MRVNLDPGAVGPLAAVDVRELDSVEAVMAREGLGPNGAVLLCMDTLALNVQWLLDALNQHLGKYLIIDTPGQIELLTHHRALPSVVQRLVARETGLRLTSVFLVDVQVVRSDNYLSASLVALSTMLQLELPHVSVLSKVDLLAVGEPLSETLSYWTSCEHLERASVALAGSVRYRQLGAAVAELIEEFNLVHFTILDAHVPRSVGALLRRADRGNGYAYGQSETVALVQTLEGDDGDPDDHYHRYRNH